MLSFYFPCHPSVGEVARLRHAIVIQSHHLQADDSRGMVESTGALFSYVELGAQSRQKHPLRKMRQLVNETRAASSMQKWAISHPTPRLLLWPFRSPMTGWLIRSQRPSFLFS